MKFHLLIRPIVPAVCVCWLSFATALPAPVQSNSSPNDAALLQMSSAAKRGDTAQLTQLLPQLKGHPLEPWAAYWEIKARLDEVNAAQVQAFFTRYAATYQEDRLRNDWLLLLGQRRDWASFAREYPRFRMNDDKEVRCYALLTDFLSNGAQVADEVRKTWFAQREADDGCATAATRLLAANQLSALDVWRKARQGIQTDRAKVAAQAVEMVAPQSLTQLKQLSSNPKKFLADQITASGTVRKELVVLALIKLATSDADAAAYALENKWGVHLSTEERNWTWGAIGKEAAQRLDNNASDYFAKVSRDGDLADDTLTWKVRTALRNNQPRWPLVLAAINAMSEPTRKEPVWVYWKARALLATAAPTDTGTNATAQRHQAATLFQSIASARGFYEQLAQEELGQKIALPPPPTPLSDEEKQAIRLHAGLYRATYAIALGLRSEGVREWNYSTNLVNTTGQRGGMSDRELLAAAQLACDMQIWDRCINTSDRTQNEWDWEQRFPMPFREAVIKRSRSIGLDPAYVYGLIRQESRFVMDARSGVGASGLMQVMPATARWTAKKLGLRNFELEQLDQHDTNIAIGTGYLKLVLDDFAGSMPMAAAAYNAGPNRPRNWRNGPHLEAAAWIENIPFNETRDYVKKVLSNTVNYAARITGQPQSLKARLGYVGPRDINTVVQNNELP